MSTAVAKDSMELDEGLEWIKLRQELDDVRQREQKKLRPSYKYNWYMPLGLSITSGLYLYGLYHKYDVNKYARASYCRITAQFLCVAVFAYGFLKHHNREIKLYKDEMRLKKRLQNAVNSN